MSFQTDLAAAITRFENVNPSYNNPGAIWDSSTNRVRRYATYEEGYQALLNTINSKISRGHTLASFFAEYAPSMPGDPVHGSNNPAHYANTVAGWLGIPVDVPLAQLVNGAGPGNTSIPSSPGTNPAQGEGPGWSVTGVWGEGEEPNWLIVGLGVGAVIWALTD